MAKNIRTACGPVGRDDTMEKEFQELRLSFDAEKANNKQLEQEKRTTEDCLSGSSKPLSPMLKKKRRG
ncbi:hypothetical protein ZWY2020_021642 [Hordeum vulgare]|nr:hypothetical protein ZWY2020_021642 [Hordeum vulgare]